MTTTTFIYKHGAPYSESERGHVISRHRSAAGALRLLREMRNWFSEHRVAIHHNGKFARWTDVRELEIES